LDSFEMASKINEYPWGVYASTSVEGEIIVREMLTMSIDGMHCGGCVRRVTAALQSVKGVEVASVDVGSAQMAFDPDRVSVDVIAAAVNRIGFSARVEKS
jgi:copper chaperone CopZ